MSSAHETTASRTPAFIGFTLLLIITLGVIGLLFRLPPAEKQGQKAQSFDPEPMRLAVGADRLTQIQKDLGAFGNRYPGTPGHAATRQYLKASYENAGFEVHELRASTVVPVVDECELLARGQSIPVTPLQPNHLQPDTTLGDRVVGELVLFTDETLATRTSFDNVIAVVDANRPPKGLGLQLLGYLRLKVAALILVASDESALQWDQWGGLLTHQPVNFPRLYADHALLTHIGETAEIRLKVRYDIQQVPTLLGIRQNTPTQPASEAVVLTTHYDTYSVLPWFNVPQLQSVKLAQHIALVEGAARYSGTRDLVVVASGAQFNNMWGEAAALQFLGPRRDRNAVGPIWAAEQHSHREQLANVQSSLKTIANSSTLPASTENLFIEQTRYVLEALLYEKTQERVRAKARFEALPVADTQSPEYETFSQLNRETDRLRGMLGVPIADLVREHASQIESMELLPRLRKRLETLERHHSQQLDYIGTGLTFHQRLNAYQNLFQFASFVVPAPQQTKTEAATWLYGVQGRMFDGTESQHGALYREIHNSLAPTHREGFQAPLPSRQLEARFETIALGSHLWTTFRYPATTIINPDRGEIYEQWTNPFFPWPQGGWESIRDSLDYSARFLLTLTHGGGTARPAQRGSGQMYNFGGRVLVSGVGQSVLPNFPLANAIIGPKYLQPTFYQDHLGYYPYHLFHADPYGRYFLPFTPINLSQWSGFNLQAFDYDTAGVIRAAKDEGDATQKLFRSVDIPYMSSMRNITLVTFPATGVTLSDLTNPQTLAPYASVSFLRSQGLTAPARINAFTTTELTTTFLEPDTRFILAFNAGSPENELVRTIRGFALGAPDSNQAKDIGGKGYIALEHPIFQRTYEETGASMLRVNESRAQLQKEKHMLDRVTDDYLRASRDFLAAANAEATESTRWLDRLLHTWDSITYSIIIHPFLRSNISQAIVSVIWYIGLLVPFVFFFEKLAFGFTDIGRQLIAQAGIFLFSFLLLQQLHPAFGMIRSSLVILLGFVIFLICITLTILFASKASENLDLLRNKHSRVKAAEVNTLGILATSFQLGLNNMHRRKVRTGLTCATLVLITFAMIAFTSIYEDFEEQTSVIGPAPYQGLLIKKEMSREISDGEVQALHTRYASRYRVYPRKAIVGVANTLGEVVLPQLELTHMLSDGAVRQRPARTLLYLDPSDPLHRHLPLTAGRWLQTPSSLSSATELLISQVAADSLGINREKLDEGPVPTRLNGRAVMVVGTFDADRLDQLADIDRQSILPFNTEGLQSFEVEGGNILADDKEPRVPAVDAVIAPLNYASRENGGGAVRTFSAIVDLEGRPYREARDVFQRYVEQSGLRSTYGLDGAATVSVRRRASSFEGLVDLLIPLFIAAVTVLNTMKGSVYERKDELYVYNAVGIAPRYIFAMFFAESLVYAIVGSVLGYFLSQSVGAVLTAMDWTGGLNMTFASLNSVYASLAVMGAVFASTWFPAKTAVRIAATSDDSGWKVPEPEGGQLEFDLPFLFDARERLAVLSFFRHFLLNHIEGDGGTFQSSTPEPTIDGSESRLPIPGLKSQLWLKPFDLGVSQELELFIPEDVDSDSFVARLRLTHQSGSGDAWNRLNRSFIATLRRQFLHWRAVETAQKDELFIETRDWFEARFQSEAEREGALS